MSKDKVEHCKPTGHGNLPSHWYWHSENVLQERGNLPLQWCIPPKGEFTEKQLKDLEHIWSIFDAGRGRVRASRLGLMMRSFGQNPTRSELNKIKSEIKLDSDGTLEFSEFCMLISKYGKTQLEMMDELREAFLRIDLDKDGFVSSKDIYKLVFSLGENVTQKQIDKLVVGYDLHDNGKVDYNGFVAAMSSGSIFKPYCSVSQ